MKTKDNPKISITTLYGYEPFFGEDVPIATAFHNLKIVAPCHGYFAPHRHSRKSKAWAKKLGYTFNNN